jgi:hypothetical protein
MKFDTLRLMARELAEMIKKMPKLDWTQRESVRADLRRKVRRLLATGGHGGEPPPGGRPGCGKVAEPIKSPLRRPQAGFLLHGPFIAPHKHQLSTEKTLFLPRNSFVLPRNSLVSPRHSLVLRRGP